MNHLSNRVISSYPLSLPTSFAFESMLLPAPNPTYDLERKIPNKVDITSYKEMYINLQTLFRNLVSSVSKEDITAADASEIVSVLHTEMEVIDSLLKNEGQGICKPIYYYCTYEAVHNNGKVKTRTDNLPAQKLMRYKLVKTLEILSKQGNVIRFNSDVVPSSRVDALILTHMPYDLVNHHKFNKLDLLESHTGVLKNKTKWYTKYYPIGSDDISMLPFHRQLLMVLGDKSLINPSDIRLRRQILEIAIRRKWTVMSTMPKIIQDFSLDIKEPYALQFLKSL